MQTKRAERINLSISEQYLQHWTVSDALRELYQNAIDQGNWSSDKMPSAHEGKINLYIKNEDENVRLHKRTLLLGITDKASDTSKIGQFGEGYKLAMLVLLRNGIGVEITNGKERWIAELKYNKKFKTKILSIKIEENLYNSSNLIFNIYNLPKKIYVQHVKDNLNLQKNVLKVQTKNCEVLLDNCNKGRLFIKGLFICEYKGSSLFGYNFNPDIFPLGRDRKMIDGFDVTWEASKAIVEATEKDNELLTEVLDNLKKENEGEYLHRFVTKQNRLAKKAWAEFIAEYPDTIPASSQAWKISLKKKYAKIKVTILSEKYVNLLTSTSEYEEALNKLAYQSKAKNPHEVVNAFLDEYLEQMSPILKTAFINKLIPASLHWKLDD